MDGLLDEKFGVCRQNNFKKLTNLVKHLCC